MVDGDWIKTKNFTNSHNKISYRYLINARRHRKQHKVHDDPFSKTKEKIQCAQKRDRYLQQEVSTPSNCEIDKAAGNNMECQKDITTKRHWYVIQTKPKQEAIAEANLRMQSFEVYLPQIQESRRRRGKWTELIQPLFPRYLFAQLDLNRDNVAPIRSTHGVTTMVKFGELIRPVPNAFIEQLQDSSDPTTGLHQFLMPQFQKGDDVTVTTGPLVGLKGVFQAASGTERVAILMEMLGRLNTVVLNQDDIASSHGRGYL